MSNAKNSRCSWEASRIGDAGGELKDEAGECSATSKGDSVSDAVADDVGKGASTATLKPPALFPKTPWATLRMSRTIRSLPEAETGTTNLQGSSSCEDKPGPARYNIGSLKPLTSGSCDEVCVSCVERFKDLNDRGLAAYFAVGFLKLLSGNPGSTSFTNLRVSAARQNRSLSTALTLLLDIFEVRGPEAIFVPVLHFRL